MCGLAGIMDPVGDVVPRSVIGAMTAALAHRGPDDDGVHVESGIGLGARRLAIIDRSDAGHQPMVAADGDHVLVYNGEIYNAHELRRELEREGAVFRGRCDTEVVLEMLARRGEAALERFNGMFALALWRRSTRELLLARDRYGIKPLYYARRGGRLLFASEIKSLLEHPDLDAALDRETLVEYFTFQNVFTDRTMFRDVRLLPPGCLMRVDPRGRTTVRRWWDFDFREPDGPVDETALVEELSRLLEQAVRRQLVADVPVGAYLSSGMDSATVASIASRALPELSTCTVGFDLATASGLELAFDERAQARQLAAHLGTTHDEIELRAGDMQRALPDLTAALEDPRVGQCYPNWYAAQLASRSGPVVLAGTGGDELFAGYPWRYYRAVVNDDFEHYIDKYYLFWQRLIPNRTLWRLLAPIKAEVEHVWTRDIFRNVFPADLPPPRRPEDYINHSLYLEARTFLHGLLLVEDKLSMAHSLETRVPFLDNDLVDFAMHLPARLKLGNLSAVVRLNENEPGPKTQRYFQKTRDGKLLLRRAMRRHVPRAVTDAVKLGFCGPDAAWFRGPSMAFVKRELMDGEARIFDVMDADIVRELVGEHLDGTCNRRLLVWSLLSVEQWCRTFLGAGEPAAACEVEAAP